MALPEVDPSSIGCPAGNNIGYQRTTLPWQAENLRPNCLQLLINKLYIPDRLEFGPLITRTDQTQPKSYRFYEFSSPHRKLATPKRKRAYFRTMALKVWNEWRSEDVWKPVDLSGANLQGANLRGRT
jgi:hypothetical protein